MTFGEYLAQRSGLPSGTLMAHMQAIQSGAGGDTIYTTMMRVAIDESRLYLTTHEKRATFTEKLASLKPSNTTSDKLAYAHTEIASSYILLDIDSLTVLRQTAGGIIAPAVVTSTLIYSNNLL